MNNYQTVNPRITNYYSPKINVQSSPTPSDSLEKFKQNKKFTIGEWVYSQYVDGLKEETYITGQSMIKVIISLEDIYLEVIFLLFHLQVTQIIQNNNTQPVSGDNESQFNTFDQLPIID